MDTHRTGAGQSRRSDGCTTARRETLRQWPKRLTFVDTVLWVAADAASVVVSLRPTSQICGSPHRPNRTLLATVRTTLSLSLSRTRKKVFHSRDPTFTKRQPRLETFCSAAWLGFCIQRYGRGDGAIWPSHCLSSDRCSGVRVLSNFFDHWEICTIFSGPGVHWSLTWNGTITRRRVTVKQIFHRGSGEGVEGKTSSVKSRHSASSKAFGFGNRRMNM